MEQDLLSCKLCKSRHMGHTALSRLRPGEILELPRFVIQ